MNDDDNGAANGLIALIFIILFLVAIGLIKL